MALTNGARYWGRRIGTNLTSKRPVLAANDPCVSLGTGVRKIVQRVGTNLTNGKPVYAIKDCATATPQVGSRYPARRVGTNLATKKPVFALRCESCAPPNLCCPDVPTTLYMTVTSVIFPDISYFRDCALTYDAANNRWWGCVEIDSLAGAPTGGWTGVNGAGVCTGDAILAPFNVYYTLTCVPANGSWAIRYHYRTCQSPTGGRAVLLGLGCEETFAGANVIGALTATPLSCSPFHFRAFAPENYRVDITA